ncbi:hypothetical protein BH10PSE7_BH10PSE7_43560 [soil metagenome]
MTLLAEATAALRGCWRLVMEPDYDFSDFNISIAGFWRSFAAIVPLAVLAYPLFLSSNGIDGEIAVANGGMPPPLDLVACYLYLCAAVILWPVVAAILARLFGVTQHYVRYIIVYNWMSVPSLIIGLVPHVVHLTTGNSGASFMIMSLIVLAVLAYVSWFVARRALAAGAAIAAAFVIADYASGYGLQALFGV